MCGIAGILQLDPRDAEPRVRRMLAAMKHRGPDGDGLLRFKNGAAGMVRLALVDLAPTGEQPLWSPDHDVAILFNGEVYNFREHRRALAAGGYPFRGNSDTEVILALYLAHGEKFVEKLRGMFVVAIFDFRAAGREGAPRALFARGPFGVKPLYLAAPRGPRGPIVFASEIKSLLASGLVDPIVDAEGLRDFLAHGFVIQPRTIIKGVRMLETGTIESHAPDGTSASTTTWTLPPYRPAAESFEDAAARLRAVLDESVALHSFADVPVGALLSGGVDSSAIAALMRHHVRDLRTYTLRFADASVPDESAEAAALAQQLETKHRTIDVTGADVVSVLPRFAGDLDQPSVDGLNTWLVSREVARDVKGVLSGLGGDEWFAGYPVTGRMVRYAGSARGVYGVGGATAHAVERWAPRSLRARTANLAARRSPSATWVHAHRCFSWFEANDLLGLRDHGDGVARLLATRPRLARADIETPVGLSTLLDVDVYMLSQLLRDSDATSMAHGLELRVPFVDVEVGAFSRQCDDAFKLKSGSGLDERYDKSGAKRVLVHALRDVLPRDMQTRKKRGFALPFVGWLHGPAAALARDTTAPAVLRKRGLVDPSAWVRMRDNRASSDADLAWPRTWALMILELWLREVVDVVGRGDVRATGAAVARDARVAPAQTAAGDAA